MGCLFLLDVPSLAAAPPDAARRFCSLLDALYERRCRLFVSAHAPLPALFSGVGGLGAPPPLPAPAAAAADANAASGMVVTPIIAADAASGALTPPPLLLPPASASPLSEAATHAALGELRFMTQRASSRLCAMTARGSTYDNNVGTAAVRGRSPA